MAQPREERLTGTILGILAIVIWASLVGVARGTRGHVGVLAAGALANLVGGGVGIVVGQVRSGYLAKARRLPVKYVAGCGALFVAYNAALYPALQMASSEQQVVEVGLIQYLWPALTLVFAVPLLHKKALPWLWPGLIVATSGAFLAKSGGAISWRSFLAGLDTNPWAYGLALLAAISWGLYSNLARRWGGKRGVSGVPVFLVATGVVLGVVHAAYSPSLRIPLRAGPLLELAYLTVFPTLLAYVFWDIAMRRGNNILVASLSFFTPLISTIITCAYLRVPMGPYLWAASGLVMAGAAICERSIKSR